MNIVKTEPGGSDTAARAHYMISAAIDIMESTFGDRELHEKTIGRRNAFYVPPEQMDLNFYLLYEAAEAAREVRNRLDGVNECA